MSTSKGKNEVSKKKKGNKLSLFKLPHCNHVVADEVIEFFKLKGVSRSLLRNSILFHIKLKGGFLLDWRGSKKTLLIIKAPCIYTKSGFDRYIYRYRTGIHLLSFDVVKTGGYYEDSKWRSKETSIRITSKSVARINTERYIILWSRIVSNYNLFVAELESVRFHPQVDS